MRWTVLELLRWTTTRFGERGLATPRLDAELLLAHALAVPRVQLYVQFDRPLVEAELAVYREMVRRRQNGESVAYVTGRKEFWSHELLVDARVLVPRPDTETVIDEALARMESMAPELRIADVGTGSGALAITLALVRPQATVLATDVSADALTVARDNATRLGASNVAFAEGDLDAPLRTRAPFDLIVANLPYVPSGDIARLAPEVRCEPHLALDGGPDGLELVRRLVQAAPALLAPGGAIILEIGEGQADATAALLTAAGLDDVRRRADLGGILRVVSGHKS